MKNLSPHEAFELCKNGAVIIDVREEYMGYYKCFDAKNVMYCPLSKMIAEDIDFPDSELLIFADSVGLHSKEAVEFLAENGYRNIANLIGGIVEWERDGLPLLVDKAQELNGACPCQLRTHKRE